VTLVLGLDVGTQGCKGLLVDADPRRVVARASVPYGLIEGLAPGAAEQHPHAWGDAVRAVVARLLAAPGIDAEGVAAVGVSGQQHGLVVLDERDEVVRPAKLWCDTETAAEARELSDRLGRVVPTGFTASKILWLARREPEAWARVCAVMLPHDWVNFRLTGRKTAEAGDASGTSVFDPVARDWDRDAAREVDPRLPDMLPPLVDAGTARLPGRDPGRVYTPPAHPMSGARRPHDPNRPDRLARRAHARRATLRCDPLRHAFPVAPAERADDLAAARGAVARAAATAGLMLVSPVRPV